MGAGKTTLVEILEGYRERDAGEVRVLGFDPQRQRGELNRRVGIVLQRSTPMEGLTPREMLNFTAKLYDDPMDPSEALELVGLTEHADRRGSKLSGGQKRRLDLATSVIGNPDLIFLDEPTTGFDVAARRQAWSVVRGLTERGATVLLTTHYLDEAENLAQRIGMIKDGRLIFEGDVAELRREMQTDTRISWLPPAGLEAGDLPAAWSAALSEGRRGVDGRLTLPSQTPTRDLGELIDWARGRGIGELPELTVEHAEAGADVHRPGGGRGSGSRGGGSGAVAMITAARSLRVVRLGYAYMGLNLKTIYREPAALFFVVVFPIMFLVIFSSLLTFEIPIPQEAQGSVPVVTFSQYFVAGIMGVAIFGTSFNLLGNSLAVQQFDGTLKQLAATPLPKTSFFFGLIGAALVITILQLVVMLILGVFAYGVELPDAGGWLTLVWVIALGVPAGCVMGIAITAVIPSARAAPAIIQAPFILLQFVSGVFFTLSSLPPWLQWVAGVFPLRWVAQGLRSVFLPDGYKYAEPGMHWQLELGALVLGVWIVVGLGIAVLTFKWDRSG